MGFFSALSGTSTSSASAHGPYASPNGAGAGTSRLQRSLPIGHIATASRQTSGVGEWQHERAVAGGAGGTGGRGGGEKSKRERWYSVFTRHVPPLVSSASSQASLSGPSSHSGRTETRIHSAYTSRDTVRGPSHEGEIGHPKGNNAKPGPSQGRVDDRERNGTREPRPLPGLGKATARQDPSPQRGPEQTLAVSRTSSQTRDAQLARRLQWLSRSNDGGLLSDENYRLLRKAAIQRHIKLADPHVTRRAGLLNADSLATLRATHSSAYEGDPSVHADHSIFSGHSAHAQSSRLTASPRKPGLARNKSEPLTLALAQHAPPSAYRTARPTLATAFSSSSSVVSAGSGRDSSAGRSIRSRFSGIGMGMGIRTGSYAAASVPGRPVVYNTADDGQAIEPVLAADDATTPAAIRQELRTTHREAYVVQLAYDDAVQNVCDELGVGENDLRVLLADVEDMEQPQADAAVRPSMSTRKVSRSQSDSRLLAVAANGHARTTSTSVRSTGCQSGTSSLRPHRHTQMRVRSPVPPLPNGTEVAQQISGRARSNGSIAPSTTTSSRSRNRAHTPSYTICSVDRVSLPLSIATTITADPSAMLSRTDLQRVRTLIEELQTLRAQQDQVGAAYADRIAWLREAERSAELRQKARR